MLVAISRTVDYRHHWQDVTVGAILGTSLAFFSYHQYYPPLWTDNCDEPYAPRIDMEFAPSRQFPQRNEYMANDGSSNNLLAEDPSHYNLTNQPGPSHLNTGGNQQYSDSDHIPANTASLV